MAPQKTMDIFYFRQFMPNCQIYLSIQYFGVRLTICDKGEDFQYVFRRATRAVWYELSVGMSKRENRLDSRHLIFFSTPNVSNIIHI